MRRRKGKQGRTCKAGGNKDLCKAGEAIDKGSAGNGPIMCADVGMVCVYADVDKYAEDDEYNDGYDLEESKPIFCEGVRDVEERPQRRYLVRHKREHGGH